ncbi:MAG: peptide-methionine (S)-S-oxide reductase MsrA [Ilumatobacteraceae bacterium]
MTFRSDVPVNSSTIHFVNGAPIMGPFPAGCESLVVGMGCFWGAERKFWQAPGVVTTSVGYAGGDKKHPTYKEVCSGRTGHTEVVMVVFDTTKTTLDTMLRVFWENHDPTQGNRQGNDIGTQYRSAIYFVSDAQRVAAEASRDVFQRELTAAGYGPITTEIAPLGEYFYAEDYHQQYLGKNPNGYCGIGGTGVSCPIGVAGSTQRP